MKRSFDWSSYFVDATLAVVFSVCCVAALGAQPSPVARRLVILKIDGLNADLLNRLMGENDEETGRSTMPWFSKIFRGNGTTFNNFYVRGISLSAPSWSLLDTGRHSVIRGNVEYDRYTGRTYDYLNFFPFYLNYARSKQVDMPAVEVLDRAGVPLVIDAFPYDQEYQSFQLLQRGVRWQTLAQVLKKRMKSQVLAPVEGGGPTSLDELLGRQTEEELRAGIANSRILYLDFYTGDVDHQGHASNQIAALTDTVRHVDALAGRIWAAIQKSPLAAETVFVAVSDHGMNNRPDVFSQAFNLPDFFNSPAGGGHHVVTNRHQLSDYKLMGLDPMVQKVITPSTASHYLAGEASEYPTAWLDLDGNERAAVQLRNSDLNRIQLLLRQLSRKDLAAGLSEAAATYLLKVIDRHREQWTRTVTEMTEEMEALKSSIAHRKDEVGEIPKKWTTEQRDKGRDKAARRLTRDLTWWEREAQGYERYIDSLRKLLAFQLGKSKRFKGSIADLVPPRTLGDGNGIYDLQNYVVGLNQDGLVTTAAGTLDEQRSFQTINYFPRLLSQTVRNSPQPGLAKMPIDFTTLRLPEDSFRMLVPEAVHVYWLYGGDDAQLLVMTDRNGRIALRAIKGLTAQADGRVIWTQASFAAGLPLRLFEDNALQLPAGSERGQWLEAWHSEREWMEAIHRCRYSNGVIGIIEDLSPVGANIPGPPGLGDILLRYEKRRRELVQADFHVFASDGWNFNARDFNPGGNHGGFFRISTHSVWMMAGAGIPHRTIEEPYDSLNFASTILHLVGKPPPMPAKVVPIQ